MTGQRVRLARLEARRQDKEEAAQPRQIAPGVWPELAVWLRSAPPEKVQACPGLAGWLEGRTA